MASGASHRGLLALTEEVTLVLCIMRERLKSVTFTRQCLSTTRFGLCNQSTSCDTLQNMLSVGGELVAIYDGNEERQPVRGHTVLELTQASHKKAWDNRIASKSMQQ